MENRGLRLGTLFQTLEKLNVQRQTQKLGQEEIGQLRYTTSKIIQLVSAQEKSQRDSLLKHHIETILAIFDMTTDSGVILNVVLLLQEFLGKTHTGKRASVLVSNGASQILLHQLVRISREEEEVDLIICLHQVLAKLAPKDRKIGVRARLSHALPVTLHVIRDVSLGMKALHPVLIVLKYLASNSVNASFIGKNGGISYLYKILNCCGKKHLAALKVALDTLGQLVKSKSNSARTVGQGGVAILLNMFYDWHRFDSKNRHVNVRKSMLTVLKNVTNLKSGQRALKEADGIRVLYEASLEMMDSRELEGLIFTASVIMRKCFPRNRLPVGGLRSVLNYQLPQSDFHVPETVSDDGSGPVTDGRTGDGDDSSLDNDDDVSSDDDVESRKIETEEDNVDELTAEPPYKRTPEDLMEYEKFFPEQTEFEPLISDSDDSRSDSGVQPAAGVKHNPTSSPCLSASRNRGEKEFRSSSSVQSRLNTSGSSMSTSDDTGVAGLQTNRPKFVTGLLSDRRSDSGSQAEVSAVNIKTGTPVFSLDFSPRMQRRTSSPKLTTKGKKSNAKLRKPRPKSSKKLDDGSLDDLQFDMVPDLIASGVDELNLSTGEEDDEDFGAVYETPEVFQEFAAKTVSAGRFNKLAYPDIHGHKSPPFSETLYDRKFGVQRSKIFEDIDRMIHPDQVIDRVVYDLDKIAELARPQYTCQYSSLRNQDHLRIGKYNDTCCLQFDSQFECGNLRKVVQVRRYEYDLILNPDVNSNHHHQWFYFEVSNMEADVPYRFNIINCEKLNSQFNFGMRPLLYSVTEAVDGKPYWLRTGGKICYYRNHFVRSSQTTGGVRGKAYYTATFTITFKHAGDVCYLAYHYPYTYTMLQTNIYRWQNTHDPASVYFRHQTLCQTVSGNDVPVLTITAKPQTLDAESIEQLKSRPYIFLSSRVHPGESNSSWIMKGTIQYLLSDRPTAQSLREMFIFKIVPMLNPDGVINGNHRCSLTAEDLNRRWLHPCPKLHPSIYHCKGLLMYMKLTSKVPLVYCDYHGHSRRKNVFLYGCSPNMTWKPDDWDNPAMLPNKLEDLSYKTLPRYLNQTTPQFSWGNCSFMVEKSKESTARVVVWRQIGVVRSYTMESTFCGFDQGLYKGNHISIRELEEMGQKFCEALIKVKSRHSKSDLAVADMGVKSSPVDSPQEPVSSSVYAEEDTDGAAKQASIIERSESSSGSDIEEEDEMDADNADTDDML